MPNTCKSSGNEDLIAHWRQFQLWLISHFSVLALLVIALRTEKMRTKLKPEIGQLRVRNEICRRAADG